MKSERFGCCKGPFDRSSVVVIPIGNIKRKGIQMSFLGKLDIDCPVCDGP